MTIDDILENPYEFISAVKSALQIPLPGQMAQEKMAPPHRVFHPRQDENSRTSAVLLLMYPTAHGIVMPFTLRLRTLAHHAGEICFPGGGVEDGDATLEDTAIRESAEELGLDGKSVQILGAITPLYVAASHNMVYPIIGWTDTRPVFDPAPDEVERIIEIPMSALLENSNIGACIRMNHGQSRTVPCYHINSDHIWGATAMILSEFITIINTNVLMQNLQSP